jgi:HSP20 family molecular chaperone IbpA
MRLRELVRDRAESRIAGIGDPHSSEVLSFPKERFARIFGGEPMVSRAQPKTADSVPVVEADVLGQISETNALIAERAYQLCQSRGCEYGFKQGDWVRAERDILAPLSIEQKIAKDTVHLSAEVLGFDAEELEVVIVHLRAVVCGFHAKQLAEDLCKKKRIMQIVELPFSIDIAAAIAHLQGGMLEVVLPRLADASTHTN